MKSIESDLTDVIFDYIYYSLMREVSDKPIVYHRNHEQLTFDVTDISIESVIIPITLKIRRS